MDSEKVGIFTQTYDVNGYMMIDIDPSAVHGLFGGTRRGSVTEVLSGDPVPYDTGAALGRTLNIISAESTEEIFDFLDYIRINYSAVCVSIRDEIFLCRPKASKFLNGLPALIVEVYEQIK